MLSSLPHHIGDTSISHHELLQLHLRKPEGYALLERHWHSIYIPCRCMKSAGPENLRAGDVAAALIDAPNNPCRCAWSGQSVCGRILLHEVTSFTMA